MKYFISKSVILLSVFIGFQCSSSSEDEDPQPEVTSPPPPCQITGFTAIRASSAGYEQDTIIYSYANTRIVKAEWGYRTDIFKPYKYQTFKYSYYKDRLPSLIESPSKKVELFYNDKDQVTKRKVSWGGNLIVDEDVSYDASGNFKEILRKGSDGVLFQKLSFEYSASGNPSIVRDTAYGPIVTVATYIEVGVGTRPFIPFQLPILIDNNRFDYIAFKNNVNVLISKGNGWPHVMLQFNNNIFDTNGYPVTLKGTIDGNKGYTEHYKFVCR